MRTKYFGSVVLAVGESTAIGVANGQSYSRERLESYLREQATKPQSASGAAYLYIEALTVDGLTTVRDEKV